MVTLNFVSRHSCLLSQQRFFVIFKLFMLRKSCETSQQSSTAIYLDQCRDRVRNVATFFFKNFSSNFATYKSLFATKFYLLTSFMSQHSLLCHNIYQSICLILCHDRVVRCRDNLKLCRDISTLANFLLFLLELSLFHLKYAKHKVGKYSIIQH